MTDTIHIALTFDDNYVEYAIVLMTSILANKTDEKIHFHILDGGFSYSVKKQIFELENCKIEFHLVSNKLFKDYKTMILPDVISVDKLIYLDSDMVVNTSLKELWQTELDDNYVAAVEDANGKKYAKRFKLRKKTIGLTKERTKGYSKFFNTGTMLINCTKWRKDNISNLANEISTKNIGTNLRCDQVILNQLFQENVKFLNLKWNLQYSPLDIWPTYDDIEEYKLAIKNPAIIHYVGDFKPWKKGLGCFNPNQNAYFKYHKITSFALSDYKKWQFEDKLMFYKGIGKFIKRYPLFFLRKHFWKILTKGFYS